LCQERRPVGLAPQYPGVRRCAPDGRMVRRHHLQGTLDRAGDPPDGQMTPGGPREPIEVVHPVHNEAASIEATLREFHKVSCDAGLTVSFRACEDGSTDGTQEILHRLEHELPLVADCAS